MISGTLYVLLMVVILGWATWASSSLGDLLKRVGDRMTALNAALREHQAQLETRIDDRTRELQDTQAQLMHQDKMAGFGLLAAGIAHEVGNPLMSISAIVQVLERKNPDDYTRDKLALVGDACHAMAPFELEFIFTMRSMFRKEATILLSLSRNMALRCHGS